MEKGILDSVKVLAIVCIFHKEKALVIKVAMSELKNPNLHILLLCFVLISPPQLSCVQLIFYTGLDYKSQSGFKVLFFFVYRCCDAARAI